MNNLLTPYEKKYLKICGPNEKVALPPSLNEDSSTVDSKLPDGFVDGGTRAFNGPRLFPFVVVVEAVVATEAAADEYDKLPGVA